MPSSATMPGSTRLPRGFFTRDSVTVARALLGQRLVRIHQGERLAGTIVEVEAYRGVDDAAAHSHRGRRTPRNEAMYLLGGHAYVYFIYGIHHCFNIVAGGVDEPVAVLIRALEPVEGLAAMRTHRGITSATAASDRRLCSGPGKLCEALVIDREMNAADLIAGDVLFIEQAIQRPLPDDRIVAGPRVGVDYAGEWAEKPLRFFVRDNPHVSRA